MEAGFTPQLGRLDRYVRRSHVRLNASVSQHRIGWSLEEALRLANLPGEEEGRVYCFRRVILAGIPADAMRPVWMEKVQETLTTWARISIHGGDPNAGAADAIYFNSLEEALEILLRNALRQSSNEPAPSPWFASSLLGAAPDTVYANLIPVLLDRLRTSLTPGAAAAILFVALGDNDPASLLSSIPEGSFRFWLHSFDEPNNAADVPSIELPQEMATILQRAADQFGWRSPALLWLATQAVLCISPSAWTHGLAVARARAALRHLESINRVDSPDRRRLPFPTSPARIRGFDDAPASASSHPLPSINPVEPKRPLLSFATTPSLVASDPVQLRQETDSKAVEAIVAHRNFSGEPTRFAGLVFLLNALRHVGIAAALHAHPELAEASLPIHILRHIAAQAGLADDDPVLLCLSSAEDRFALPLRMSAETLSFATAWPVGFAPLEQTTRSLEHFLRAWTVAVKRWCWRRTRLTAGEIIQRRGHVSKTRTDIDVTLPIDQADVRIRLAGLDIDPGWLPWLGAYGFVVRFHYRDRETEGISC